jgi:hypothetical protein
VHRDQPGSAAEASEGPVQRFVAELGTSHRQRTANNDDISSRVVIDKPYATMVSAALNGPIAIRERQRKVRRGRSPTRAASRGPRRRPGYRGGMVASARSAGARTEAPPASGLRSSTLRRISTMASTTIQAKVV